MPVGEFGTRNPWHADTYGRAKVIRTLMTRESTVRIAGVLVSEARCAEIRSHFGFVVRRRECDDMINAVTRHLRVWTEALRVPNELLGN